MRKRSYIPLSKRMKVYKRDRYQCRFCGTSDDLVIDHIMPIRMGGTDNFTNLQTLCALCNGRKGGQYPYPPPVVEREHLRSRAQQYAEIGLQEENKKQQSLRTRLAGVFTVD